MATREEKLRRFRFLELKQKQAAGQQRPEAFGLDLPKDIARERPFLEATQKTLKEGFAIPALNILDIASLGTLRGAVRATGERFPEAETIPGKALELAGKGVGLLRSPVIKGIVGATRPLAARVATLKGIPRIFGRAGLEGLRGLGIGAAISPENIADIEARKKQALVGGGIGLLTGGLTSLFGGKIKAGLARRARLKRRGAEVPKRPLTKRIGERVTETRAEAQKQLKQISETTRQRTQDVTTKMKSEVTNIQKDLQKTAEIKSRQSQGRIQTFARRNSTAYGKELDKISDDLIKAGDKGITRVEQMDIINKTLKEADDLLLTSGPARLKVEQLKVKYSLDKVRNISELEEFLNFKEVVNDMRSISKAVSAQAKIQGFTAEDVVAAIYKKNFGDVISAKVPAFAELQKDYAPVIQAIKKAHRTFNTFRGEFATKAGTSFLKRAGEGKLEAGEKRLLTTLEKGTKRFGKGIGSISSEVKKLGSKLDTAKRAIQTQKQQAINAGNAQRIKITKNLQDRLAQLKIRKDKVEELLLKQAKFQADTAAARIKRGKIVKTLITIGTALAALKIIGGKPKTNITEIIEK